MARTSTSQRMMTAPILGFDLDIEVDTSGGYEPLPGEMEADPDWSFLDSHGHGHVTGRKGKKGPLTYPTLKEITEEGYDEIDGPYTVHVRWECKICKEEIRPGKRAARPQPGPARITYTVTLPHEGGIITYQCDQKKWNEVCERFAEAVSDVLGPEHTIRTEWRS